MPFPGFRRATAPVTLAIAFVLAGCASTHGLAPQDRPTQADSLAAGESLGRFSKADFPRDDWWNSLGDPQLDALIDEALRGTPTLAAADARLRSAIAQAGLADSLRKPSLAVGAQYAGLRIPETVGPGSFGGSYQGIVLLTMNFKYDPDFWGVKRAKWQAAIGQARAAEVEAQAARLMLASNIASTYVVLAQAHAAQDVAVAEKERASHLLELSRQRVQAGLDSQLPLRQAEAGVAAAQQEGEAAQQHIDAARNALAALLGKGPDRALSISKPTLLAAPAPGVPSVLPSELLGHRPDVVAARWRVEAAERGIDSSKAAFYPTVNLSALVGLASGGLTDLFATGALLVQGGPAISLPVFDGGGLRNQLAKSDADYDLAVATYNESLVTALREVTDALQAAIALDAQIASTRKSRDAASAAWQLAQSRYHAGLGTQLDVLAAQQPLLQLDQQLAALHAQRLTAVIDLDRALGGGINPVAPSSASDLAASR